MSERLARIVGWTVRRPVPVLAVVALLALGGGALALRLQPSAGADTLVSRGSASYRASQLYHQRFGDDAVIVLVREQLTRLTLSADIQRLLELEGCISGNVPAGKQPYGGARSPCADLAREKPVKVVYGPGTFLNEAVGEVADQVTLQQQAATAQAKRAAEAARKVAAAQGASKAQQQQAANSARQLVAAQYIKEALTLGLRYGVRPPFQLNNPNFVYSIVFDPARGAQTPKARFAYLFPNSRSALVQVRLRPDLTQSERHRAIADIRAAVRMPRFNLSQGSYTVSGAPVVVDDLARSLTGSIGVLLLASLLVMAGTLALVFRARARLLPLALALAAAGLTFGGMSLAGASLTMASIAVLPVLIGLGVDYAIQLQSRWEEERPAAGGDPREAGVRAAAAGGPTIATAGIATAVGFLVLLLSPVPMVRGFGVLLVAGIVVAFLCALTAGFAALALVGRPGRSAPPAAQRAREALASAWRGAGELLGSLPAVSRVPRAGARVLAGGGRLARGAFSQAITRPGRVLAIGAAVAVLGWAADTQTSVVSDINQLVPRNLQAIRDVDTLQRSTGVSGEIDVLVRASDLAEPGVVRWMSGYQQRLLKRYGYTAKRGCGKARLCPALSLPDLFQSQRGALTRQSITGLLNAVPPYFSQAVITPDHTMATLAFGIKLMPLDEQKAVIDEMRRQLRPPSGVTAQLAGLPVLAAEANARLASPWRRALTLLAGLAAVLLVLLAVYRRVERAVIPLIPIALATGWSALILFALRIPLNPMSATLGALVIAISTEFGVLLSARYRAERGAGHPPAQALERTYRSTGSAVLASGATAIAGFAVLILSNIRMLRDFGFVTVVDLTVSLLGVMVVLPAALVLAERGELLAFPRRAWDRLRRMRVPLRRAPAAESR